MYILVCIDDTDNIDSKGTGELASMIAQDIEKKGWGKTSGITRHQLLVHPDIPYTSHNSSMCFSAEIDEIFLGKLITDASDFLVSESAEGSDPGLCVVVVDQLISPELLINFGRKAKELVLTKEEAYELANKMGIHLSEHGGTGQGIIGALAGAGLRLTGNDGRFKGKHKINAVNNVATVSEIYTQADIDLVKSLDGFILSELESVRLGEKVKSVLLEEKSVLLVTPTHEDSDGVKWEICSRQQLKNY